MACKKHGYNNPTFCPACDQEIIEREKWDAAFEMALAEQQYEETRQREIAEMEDHFRRHPHG